MANSGFWVDGLEGTVDRMNACLLQYDIAANREAAGQTGRMFFATDTRELSRDNGTGWDSLGFLGTGETIFKDADESVTSSTALQDDDDFAITVAANEKWHFKLILRISGNTAGDLDVAWTVPAGAAGQQWSTGDLLAAAGFTAIDITTEKTIQTTATEQTIIIEGYIIVGGTAGTAQFRWAQNASNGTATIIHAESHMLAWRE